MQGLNYLYDDFGSKISVNFIGPFGNPTNLTRDSIFIHTQIGDRTYESRRFDIRPAVDDQIKPDHVHFDIALDISEMRPEQLNLSMQITTNTVDSVIFQMYIDPFSLDKTMGAICGGIILIVLNVLIISEVKTILNGFL